MNTYLLHFEGSYSYDIEVDAIDKEQALKIGKAAFECADANEFDFEHDEPDLEAYDDDDDE